MEDLKMNKTSVVLIDNHSFYREGMKHVLESHLNFDVIADGDKHLSVIELVLNQLPTLLLIDVNVLREHNINLTDDIVSHSPDIKIIVIAFEDEGSFVTEALKQGAHGFLLKNMNIESFVQAIEAVLNGKYQVEQKMSHYVAEDYVSITKQMNGHKNDTETTCPLHIYTKRECEVLQLLAKGMSNRTISETLKISEKTVKNHVSSLFKKMNVNDRTQAVITAIRNNWVNIN